MVSMPLVHHLHDMVEQGTHGTESIGHDRIERPGIGLKYPIQQAKGCRHLVFARTLGFRVQHEIEVISDER